MKCQIALLIGLSGLAPCVRTAERKPAWLPEAEKMLCKSRPYCAIIGQQEAGKNRDGDWMTIVQVDLHPEQIREDSDCRDDDDQLKYYLVIHGAKRIAKVGWLFDACEGAYGRQQFEISVNDNRVTYSNHPTYGTSIISEDFTVRLDPTVILEESRSEGSVYNTGEHRFNWQTLSGEGYFPEWVCDPPEDQQEYGIAAHYLPMIQLPDAFSSGGWRTTPLGGCAAAFDAKRGFQIHGRTDLDTRFKAVISPGGELFVEIRDDRWIDDAPSWIHTDHLEIWIPDQPLQREDAPCAAETAPKARQWGIRIADGKLDSGHGGAAAPFKVEVAPHDSAARVRRLKITFSATPGRMTLVYSDSDDGKSQRLLATSSLEFGKAETIGVTFNVPAARAICRLKEGRLEPELLAIPLSLERPLIP